MPSSPPRAFVSAHCLSPSRATAGSSWYCLENGPWSIDRGPFCCILVTLRKLLLTASVVSLLVGTTCAQTTPTITVSPSLVLHHDHVVLRGSGFTANGNAYSHL